MDIKTLLDLPDSGIAGFFNETDRKVYLIYSEALIDALIRNVRQLKDGSHSCKTLVDDRNKLVFKVIETNNVNLKHDYMKWSEEYKKDGYELYRNFTPIRLYVKIAYSKNLRSIEVRIYNRRYEWFVVGVFSTMKDAEIWMNDNYPNKTVKRIVYADNVLTKEHLSNIEMKKGKI